MNFGLPDFGQLGQQVAAFDARIKAIENQQNRIEALTLAIAIKLGVDTHAALSPQLSAPNSAQP